jgi:hypothetical protein
LISHIYYGKKEIEMKTFRIEDVDRNFVPQKIGDIDLVFGDISNKPFEVSGLAWFDRERKYCRLPEARLGETNEGVRGLAWHTSGAMVRFKTNSKTLAIKYELWSEDDMSHMPRTGISGFDVYKGVGKDKRFKAVSTPEVKKKTIEALLIRGESGKLEEWSFNFPLYNGVMQVQIGLDPDSLIEPPTPYSIPEPILFYGSSITQGGCASRPGNAYTHILCRWLDANMLNFGFSGSAKAEPVMAELMGSIEMSAFVYDYDHNAPSVEYLEKTHEPFFKLMRQAKPDVPIIMVGRPDFYADSTECCKRREIIQNTYENALKSGDRLVYYIDNELLFGSEDRDSCTVDGCHPNDLGFMRMAEVIYPVLRRALAGSK